MIFKYKAAANDGKISEGQQEAADKYAVARALKEQGLTIVYIEEAQSGHSRPLLGFMNLKTLNKISFSGRVTTREKINFARNGAAMLDAGLSLAKILSVMERQTRNKKWKSVLNTVDNEISAGKTFSESLSQFPKVFSPLFISMVRAGEEGGNLSKSLRLIADQTEKMYLLQKRLKGALIYPAIILCLMLIIGVLMFIYVVPTLTNTFKELHVQLPLSTRVIIFISDFLKDYTVWAALIFIAVVSGVYLAVKTATGKKIKDYLIIRVPMIGEIVKQTYAARTARTLSSLLSAGVEFVLAVDITSSVIDNSYYKKVLAIAHDKVQKGDPISEVFLSHEKLYPIFVGEMMNVGEETGQLSAMLEGVATYYEGEVDQSTKDLSTIVEPFLMIIIGAAVGFFAVSMISPTYSVLNNI